MGFDKTRRYGENVINTMGDFKVCVSVGVYCTKCTLNTGVNTNFEITHCISGINPRIKIAKSHFFLSCVMNWKSFFDLERFSRSRVIGRFHDFELTLKKPCTKDTIMGLNAGEGLCIAKFLTGTFYTRQTL
jgi:hypothetical protein